MQVNGEQNSTCVSKFTPPLPDIGRTRQTAHAKHLTTFLVEKNLEAK